MKSQQIGEIETCAIPDGVPSGRRGIGIWAGAITELLKRSESEAICIRAVCKLTTGHADLQFAAKRKGVRIHVRTKREDDGVIAYTIWRRNGEPK